MVIQGGNHARSPATQLVCKGSFSYRRFFVHQNLKEITGFDCLYLSVQGKNINFYTFLGIPWDIPQKNLEFSDS